MRYVRDLVRAYENSPEWKNLKQSTRDVEKYMIKTIQEDFGNMPLSLVEKNGSRRIFKEWHNDMGEERGLRAADMRMGRLQTIFKFGCDQEALERNPIATFKRLHKVDRSMVIWTPAHFAQFNAVASVDMKLAAFPSATHRAAPRGFDGDAVAPIRRYRHLAIAVEDPAACLRPGDAGIEGYA